MCRLHAERPEDGQYGGSYARMRARVNSRSCVCGPSEIGRDLGQRDPDWKCPHRAVPLPYVPFGVFPACSRSCAPSCGRIFAFLGSLESAYVRW